MARPFIPGTTPGASVADLVARWRATQPKSPLAGTPQPSADLLKMAKGTRTAAEVHEAMSGGAGKLYDWADANRTPEGQARIEGLHWGQAAGPATIHKTTLDQVLQNRYYGDAYPDVRQEAINEPDAPGIEYGSGSLERHLENPFYIFMAEPDSRVGSGAIQGLAIVEPGQMGLSAQRIANHEIGHAVSPGPLGRSQIDSATASRRLVQDYPVLEGRPNVLQAFADRINYLSSIPEVAANLNALRRLHYGVTGNPLLREADRIRFLKDVALGRTMNIGRPRLKVDTMFPGDPRMKFGPRAGEKAEGYNSLRQQMRQILPNLSPDAKRAVISIFNKGADASNPNDQIYA